jgi:hypothetical protein
MEEARRSMPLRSVLIASVIKALTAGGIGLGTSTSASSTQASQRAMTNGVDLLNACRYGDFERVRRPWFANQPRACGTYARE